MNYFLLPVRHSFPAIVAKATIRLPKLYNKQVGFSKLYGGQVAEAASNGVKLSIINKKIIILFLTTILWLNAQQPTKEKFFIRADVCDEPKEIKIASPVLKDFSEKQDEQISEEALHITLHTKSGLEIPALFFDRKSNTALILGQGIPAPKEAMLKYAKLFSNYDIILFDYRWRDSYASSLLKSLALCSPTQKILLDEEEEILAVIDFVKNRKNYEKIIGLGECYSNFLFAKIQSDEVQKSGKGPFTNLILDSCWHSFKAFAESISSDPYLPIEPQDGGAPWILKKLTNNPIIKWTLLKIVFTFLQNVSIEEYLPNLKIPVLFIYGINDLFILNHHFESLWNTAEQQNRSALITPYKHADNLQNKSVYRFVCEQFINSSSITEFIENCNNLFK